MGVINEACLNHPRDENRYKRKYGYNEIDYAKVYLETITIFSDGTAQMFSGHWLM